MTLLKKERCEKVTIKWWFFSVHSDCKMGNLCRLNVIVCMHVFLNFCIDISKYNWAPKPIVNIKYQIAWELEVGLFKNKLAPKKPAGAAPIRPTKSSTEAFRYGVGSPFSLLMSVGWVIGCKICTLKRNRTNRYICIYILRDWVIHVCCLAFFIFFFSFW